MSTQRVIFHVLFDLILNCLNNKLLVYFYFYFLLIRDFKKLKILYVYETIVTTSMFNLQKILKHRWRFFIYEKSF